VSAAVLHWAGYAQQAGKAHHIPASVLLGLVDVESAGVEGRTSRAGAGGLTQFVPGTARLYGVDTSPGHARSQIDGAARYLNALGYQTDPRGALAKYNGGPGNPQYGYADKVLAAARRYGAQGLPPAAGAPTSTGQDTAGGDQGLVTPARRSDALKALLTVTAVLGGAGLVYIGANTASGGAIHTAAKGAVIAGAMA
jgi:hypothetical protein